MSVIARLEVIPQREASMTEAVARAVEALDQFDVSYETTPTDTIVEAEDATEVFAAAEAAHRAVEGERVITSLEVEDQPRRSQRGRDRVESVERRLGRPARRRRDAAVGSGVGVGADVGRGAGDQPEMTGQGRPTAQQQQAGRQQSTGQHRITEWEQPPRYGGPWRPDEQASGGQSGSGEWHQSGPTNWSQPGSGDWSQSGSQTGSQRRSRYLGSGRSGPR